jgi:hypothetical protein
MPPEIMLDINLTIMTLFDHPGGDKTETLDVFLKKFPRLRKFYQNNDFRSVLAASVAYQPRCLSQPFEHYILFFNKESNEVLKALD